MSQRLKLAACKDELSKVAFKRIFCQSSFRTGLSVFIFARGFRLQVHTIIVCTMDILPSAPKKEKKKNEACAN